MDLAGGEVPLLGDTVDGFQGAGGIGGLLARTDMDLWVANKPFASACYFSDAQGNVVGLAYTNETMVAQYEYDPFGNIISMTGPLASANRYRFSSKEWNENAGIYYYGGRFYAPDLQRWPNRDPILEFGGINLYGFVGNDPIQFFDPLGECEYFGGNSGNGGSADFGHFWTAVDAGNGEVLRFDYGMKGYNGPGGSSGQIENAYKALNGAPGQAKVTPFPSIQAAAGKDPYYTFDTLPGQDNATIQNMFQAQNNPPTYNLAANNCGTESFRVAGWPSSLNPTVPTPGNYLNVVQQQWNQLYNSPPMNVAVNNIAPVFP
jgi:RHS repeat-associated protein